MWLDRKPQRTAGLEQAEVAAWGGDQGHHEPNRFESNTIQTAINAKAKRAVFAFWNRVAESR